MWSASVERDPDGVLCVGGVDLIEVAERFGTPAYLFDEADFLRRCTEFRDAFDGFDVYYAGKAFLCKAVARLVARAGLRLDVCTAGELALALAAGFPASEMVLHGNNKSDRELEMAVEHGVGRVVVDSFDELDRLTELAARRGIRPRVLVRLTVGVRSDAHDHNATAHDDQKFGFLVSTGAAASAVARIRDEGVLDLRGLHSHVGSQIFDDTAFTEAAGRLVHFRAQLGGSLPELSLGGGFAIPYTEADLVPTPSDLAKRLRAAVSLACQQTGTALPRLAIEPGRAIAGPAGCTLYRVGTVKEAGGRTYIAVDGGVSDNLRPALFGTNYTVTLANRVSSAAPTPVRVVGRHCDAGDILVHHALLPADLRPGDLLAIAATGAYCRSWSNNFNHTPRPPVIALTDGHARVIVRRETEEDLFRLDVG